MECSVGDCWRWLVLLAPTLFFVWSFCEVRQRSKYTPNLYDQERVRSLEHFYRYIVGENPEYDAIGRLEFAFDRELHFVPIRS